VWDWQEVTARCWGAVERRTIGAVIGKVDSEKWITYVAGGSTSGG